MKMIMCSVSLFFVFNSFVFADDVKLPRYVEDSSAGYHVIKNVRPAEKGFCFAVKGRKIVYLSLEKCAKYGAVAFRYESNAKKWIVSKTGKAAGITGLNSTKGLKKSGGL